MWAWWNLAPVFSTAVLNRSLRTCRRHCHHCQRQMLTFSELLEGNLPVACTVILYIKSPYLINEYIILAAKHLFTLYLQLQYSSTAWLSRYKSWGIDIQIYFFQSSELHVQWFHIWVTVTFKWISHLSCETLIYPIHALTYNSSLLLSSYISRGIALQLYFFQNSLLHVQ